MPVDSEISPDLHSVLSVRVKGAELDALNAVARAAGQALAQLVGELAMDGLSLDRPHLAPEPKCPSAARRRSAADRSRSAKKAARTKGAAARKAAARKAARTRARRTAR